MSIWRLMYNPKPLTLRAGASDQVAGVRKSGPVTGAEVLWTLFVISQLTCPTHSPQGLGALARSGRSEVGEIQPSNHLLFSFPCPAAPTILII